MLVQKKVVLTNGDYKLLRALCSMTQPALKNTLISTLKKKYSDVLYDGKFIMAKGDIPIALIAHMDTVFSYPPEDIYYDKEQNVIWSPDGLGADDRAGIFAILQILKRGFRPTIIFTEDEESGCLGATDLVTKIEEAPWPINFCIQLDRRGENDCVFYDCDNPDFEKYIEQYGFEKKFGSFTDIAIICPDWGMAGVNLSVGYKDEHSISETLRPGCLINTINKVCNLLTDFISLAEDEQPKFEYIPIMRGGWDKYGTYCYGGYYDDSYSEDYWKSWYEQNRETFATFKCTECGRTHFYDDELISLPLVDGSLACVCDDCITNFDWCPKCDTPFRFLDTKGVCPKCGHKRDNNAGY